MAFTNTETIHSLVFVTSLPDMMSLTLYGILSIISENVFELEKKNLSFNCSTIRGPSPSIF